MKIREAMTPDVRMVRPDQTIRDAAQLMAETRHRRVAGARTTIAWWA